MNGESYGLKRSRENAASQAPAKPEDASRTVNAAPSYSCNVATLTDLLRQPSGRWYTVTLPQWPNLSAPFTPVRRGVKPSARSPSILSPRHACCACRRTKETRLRSRQEMS